MLTMIEPATTAVKQGKLVSILQGLQQQVPELQEGFGRVLLHAAATAMCYSHKQPLRCNEPARGEMVAYVCKRVNWCLHQTPRVHAHDI